MIATVCWVNVPLFCCCPLAKPRPSWDRQTKQKRLRAPACGPER